MNIPACRLLGVSVLGITGLNFVNPGIKINGKYYRETLLKEKLLPDMRDISEYFIFQQESTSAKETVDLSTETSSLNPPNSPDLNPVNFSLVVNPGASVQGEGQHFS